MHLRRGNRYAIDHGLAGHAIIAVWMIHGHKTLIAPEEMDLSPIERDTQISRREQLIDALRGRAAGETEAETFRRSGNEGSNEARGFKSHGLRIRRGMDDRRGRHKCEGRPGAEARDRDRARGQKPSLSLARRICRGVLDMAAEFEAHRG